MLSALVGRQPRNVIHVDWAAGGSWGEGGGTVAGPRVTVDSATQLMAVYGSASLITDQISTLPVDVKGGTRPAWVDEPTEGLDRAAWLSQILWSLLLSGGTYLDPRYGRKGLVAIDVLDPERCQVRSIEGRRVVHVNGVSAPNVVYIPGRMKPGALMGVSPVEWCRQTIGLGLAAQKYGAEFFNSEGNMPGVIEMPGAAQPEALNAIARQWRRKRSTGGRGLPGMLDNGATWKPTGVTNEQAQFLATRQFTDAQIAGQMFLLDPSDLGIPVQGTTLNYSNQQQRDARRMKIALMPWVRRLEPALSRLLLGGEYHFDVDSTLRGNTKESYETLAVALAAGFMTIDEVRAILGMPPRPNTTEAPTARELAEMIQKIYLGVGVVLTADEAREILNSGGANLPPGFEPGAPGGGTS